MHSLLLATAASALAAGQPPTHDHGPAPVTPAPHGAHEQPAPGHGAHRPTPSPPPTKPTDPHAGHVMTPEHSAAGHANHGEPGHAMRGALGPYPFAREASGTAWQPDSSQHGGVHLATGGWHLMGHGLLNAVYDRQGGPRGDDDVFLSGMVMGIAQRPFADGSTLQFKAMLSPDPLMGRSGYPLLLASGETANGVDLLIDRQHPHDLFMELSASYSIPLGARSSAFLYAGLPGEPAFGPPTFMHRLSAMDSPEAPITHHWLDSTHITFGVVTAGLVLDRFKLEASRFNGREPDQHRYDIETGPLDSTAVRLSWNPIESLSLQASWARLISPEQLEPGENQTRWSASAIHTRRLGPDSWWSTSAAWGRRSSGHHHYDAFALESAVALSAWTLFGRAEYAENNELVAEAGHHGPAYKVGKVSLGAIHDFELAENVKFGVGGLYAFNFVPSALEPSYGGDPRGGMAFVRLKVD